MRESSSWHSYPSIYAVGHRAVADIFAGPVTVEEKVDGSQFSFGVVGGELRCRSKGQQLVVDQPEKMFAKAVDVVKSLADRLHPGWTYRAEYLQKPKHNTLAYGRVPANYLAVFDINTGEEEYLPYAAKREEAARLGLETVPLLYGGIVAPDVGYNVLKEFLNHESFLGNCLVEGFVVKNYSQFGPDKKALMAKFVSEAFKEKHKVQWRVDNPTKTDVVQALILALRTDARWRKAVQHLKEQGRLDGSPKDIGPLIQELVADVDGEETDTIKDALFEWAWPQIRRGIVAGFPEWYKEELLKTQFTREGEGNEYTE